MSTSPGKRLRHCIKPGKRFDVGTTDDFNVLPSFGGAMNHSGLKKYFSGILDGGYARPSVRGSVIFPVSAEAAAVSGEHRYT